MRNQVPSRYFCGILKIYCGRLFVNRLYCGFQSGVYSYFLYSTFFVNGLPHDDSDAIVWPLVPRRMNDLEKISCNMRSDSPFKIGLSSCLSTFDICLKMNEQWKCVFVFCWRQLNENVDLLSCKHEGNVVGVRFWELDISANCIPSWVAQCIRAWMKTDRVKRTELCLSSGIRTMLRVQIQMNPKNSNSSISNSVHVLILSSKINRPRTRGICIVSY